METPSENLGSTTLRTMRRVAYWFPPLRAWVKKNGQRCATQALESYLSGDLDLAESKYREALLWQPHDAGLYSSLAQVSYEQGKPSEAEKQFRQALDFDYLNLRALKGLGVVLQERGELFEPMYLYLKYLELQPKDAIVCHNLGAVFYNMGEYEKAVEYYARAEKEEPGDPLFTKNRAIALLALSRFEEAKAALLRAQQTAPNDGDLDLLLGYVHDALEDTNGALESFRSCLEKDPENAEAHLQFAILSTREGHYQDTVQHARAAADSYRRESNDASAGEACWELGWGYYALGDWAKSIEASTEALALNPTLSPVYFNLGLALLQQGQTDEARRHYEEGIGKLTQVSDLKEHGIDDLDDAIKAKPDLPGGREILAELEKKYDTLASEVARVATT